MFVGLPLVGRPRVSFKKRPGDERRPYISGRLWSALRRRHRPSASQVHRRRPSRFPSDFPAVSDSLAYFATGIEILLMLYGALLFWRVAGSPAARANRPPPALLPWDAPLHEFLLFLFLVLFGAMTASFLSNSLGRGLLKLVGDEITVFNGAFAQLGMLGGIAAYRLGVDKAPPAPANIFTSGAATFLISLPILTATSFVWQTLLEWSGLPVEKQDLIDMFANVDSPVLLTIMIVLAIVTAPLSEELIFRAGLFRYFRTRMPRWAALTVPAAIFASLHVNWQTFEGLASLGPLMMLAVIFSLAYERTGRIGTSMVAHALFNLNTILLIFSGASV
jgi:membrane protease YdiL (CAAX protease family)